MIRETSRAAYEEIKENGVLSTRLDQAYAVLKENGPLTGSQISLIMRRKFNLGAVSENVRNRLGELRDLGLAREIGKVKCPVTGRTVIQWKAEVGPMKIKKKRMRCGCCSGKGYYEVE